MMHRAWSDSTAVLNEELARAISGYIKTDSPAETNCISYARMYEKSEKKPMPFEIKKVIFNDPATIVLWEDGTKTIVKCGDGDIFDPEKGLAMAICKRVYGNKFGFHKIFKQWLPENNPNDDDVVIIGKVADFYGDDGGIFARVETGFIAAAEVLKKAILNNPKCTVSIEADKKEDDLNA